MSQPERSSEERDEQPKNIWDRSVTLDVSQQETSKAKSEEQLQNVSCRFLSLGTTSKSPRMKQNRKLYFENKIICSDALETKDFQSLLKAKIRLKKTRFHRLSFLSFLII